ncbi:MAG: 5'-nucleotidase C-terminal domain-containing protein [Caldisericia bacterium]|nr:5'-nucleotidase C-terminal domain-containing protein [Caldisericia bacterium]
MVRRSVSIVLACLLMTASSLFFLPVQDAKALDIFPFVILATGNVRGQLDPISSGPNQGEGGMTKAATVINEIRKDITSKEGYHMLVDAGNTIVGSSLSNFFTKKPLSGKAHPMIEVMNTLQYDAAGWSSIDFSLPAQLRDARKRESKFTWVSTNAMLGSSLYAADHRMLVFDVPNSAHVLKIAVISLPDPTKTLSIPSDSIKGMEFYDPIEEVMKASDQLKDLERADFIVLLTDMEWERDPAKQKQSYLYQLLERSRIDVCIPASDEPIAGEQILYPDTEYFTAHDVLVSSPGRYGLGVSRVELVLEKCKCPVKPYEVMKKENGARNITGKVVKIGKTIKEDPTIKQVVDTYKQTADNTFNDVVGTASQTISSSGGTYRQTSLANLVLSTMKETAKSDIAIIKPSEIMHNLNKGPLTYGDIYSLISADDMIYSISLTGKQIKAMLEESADYFQKGLTSFGLNTLNMSYSMNLTLPVNNRVKDLKINGKPFVAGTTYKVAVVASNLASSGRLSTLSNIKIQTNTRKTLRDALIDKLKKDKTIQPNTTANWTLVPDFLDHWALESIQFLQTKKVIAGYSDGRFLPDKTITRAEYTKIATSAYGITEAKPATPSFTDVLKKDWFYGFVEAAKQKGMIPFADSNFFFPNKQITREEAMIELVVALRNDPNPPALTDEMTNQFKQSVKDIDQISSLALPYMIYASNEGLIKGYADGTIKPKNPISRAETATIIFRAHYPTVFVNATGNVESKIDTTAKDPIEDRPIGGLASVASYINQFKKTYANQITIDAGNYVMGSSVSFLSNGEAIGDIYQKIGYQFLNISDEDFFYGIPVLENVEKRGQLAILNNDIVYKSDSKSLFTPYKTVMMAGLEVGITGNAGFSIEKPHLHDNVNSLIQINDSIKSTNDVLAKMKQENLPIQIVITGIEGYVNMAGELSSSLATYIDGLNPKPSLVIALDRSFGFSTVYKNVPVIAPGTYGNSIGTAKIIIDAVTKKIEKVDLKNQYSYADELTPSAEINTMYNNYETTFNQDLDKVIATSKNGLKTFTGGESPLGNLITDIMRETFNNVQIAMITPNLLLGDLPQGNITNRNVFNMLPKDEHLVLLEMKGSDVIKVFEHGATFNYGMIQISGAKFKYDNYRFLYDRVVESFTYKGTDLSDTEPIEYEKIYRVLTTESLRRGLDNYEAFASGTVNSYHPISLRTVVIQYLEKLYKEGKPVDREVEGRIELVYTG